MKVVWTHHAIAQLVDIYEFIARDSPSYAQRMVDRLTRRSEQVGRFPQSGRKVPEYETPEIREVLEGSYRIIYRLQAARIDIIAVLHSSQQLPPTL